MINFYFNDKKYSNITLESRFIQNSREFCDDNKNIKTNLSEDKLILINIMSGKIPNLKIDKKINIIYKMWYLYPILQTKYKWFNINYFQWYMDYLCMKINKYERDDIIEMITFCKYYGLDKAEIFLNIYFAIQIFPTLSNDEIIEIFYNSDSSRLYNKDIIKKNTDNCMGFYQ
jgi:hypothetical protein